MQTPRGFLIGAGVIAAIAALTSIGHPHTETAVETTAPIVTDAIEDTTTTTNATTTDPETRVLAEHVEAGLDAGADAASVGAASVGAASVGTSTTMELSNGDPAAAAGDTMSTPAAENRQDSADSTVEVRDGAGSQTDDPVVDSAPQTSPATTLAPTTTAAPATTAPPTTLAPTITAAATTTAPSATRVTVPKIDVNVPQVTVPKVVVPAEVVPVVPTPPK